MQQQTKLIGNQVQYHFDYHTDKENDLQFIKATHYMEYIEKYHKRQQNVPKSKNKSSQLKSIHETNSELEVMDEADFEIMDILLF